MNEMKTEMGTLEETVQRLQREVDRLQEMSLKPAIVVRPNFCANIKPPVFDGKTS